MPIRLFDGERNMLKFVTPIVNARIEKNLTQSQLAKKARISQPSLARFESGRANPTLSYLYKLFAALDLKLDVVPFD
jgi:transcriptional regulator with XRE-family HTH domain